MSVNRVVLGMLADATGLALDGKPGRSLNLDRFVGMWSAEEADALDALLGEMRRD